MKLSSLSSTLLHPYLLTSTTFQGPETQTDTYNNVIRGGGLGPHASTAWPAERTLRPRLGSDGRLLPGQIQALRMA